MHAIAPNSVLAGRLRHHGPPAMPMPRSLVPRTMLEPRDAAHMPARRALGTAERPSPTRTQPLDSEAGRGAAEVELKWSQVETVNEEADIKRQQASARSDLVDTSEGRALTSVASTQHGHLPSTQTSSAAMDADLRYLDNEEAHLSSDLAQLSISTDSPASQDRTVVDNSSISSGGTSSPSEALSDKELERRSNISKSKAATVPWNKGLGVVRCGSPCFDSFAHRGAT